MRFRDAHEPDHLADLALHPTSRRVLTGYVEAAEPPDLLLVGPAEAEPEQVAQVFAESFDVEIYRSIPGNTARSGGGSRVPRRFLRTATGRAWKVGVVERVDELTPKRGAHLASILSSGRSSQARVVATARSLDETLPAIRDQMAWLEIRPSPADEKIRVIRSVLADLDLESEQQEGWETLTRLPYSVPRILDRLEQRYRTFGSLEPSAGAEAKVSPMSAPSTGEDNGEEEIDWEWEPYAGRGLMTLLFGKAKRSGKSTLLGHLAARKSRGETFLGQQLRPGSVLWVGLDEALSFTRSRLARAGADMGKIFRWEAPAAGVEEVAEEAMRRDVDLVVVDTLTAVADVPHDSDNASWDTWFQRAKAVVRRSDAAWLFVHHPRKSGGPALEAARGASAIYNNVDLIVRLERHGDEPSDPRCIEVEGTRAEIWPSALFYERQDGRLKVVDPDEVQSSDASSDTRTAILEVVGSEWMTRKEIITALEEAEHDTSDTTVHRRLDDLVEEAELERAGEGKPGDPHRWRQPAEEGE